MELLDVAGFDLRDHLGGRDPPRGIGRHVVVYDDRGDADEAEHDCERRDSVLSLPVNEDMEEPLQHLLDFLHAVGISPLIRKLSIPTLIVNGCY